MESKLHLRNIEFFNLIMYEKALSLLSPLPTLGTLNSSIVFNRPNKLVSLYIQDTTSIIKIEMPCEILEDTFDESDNHAFQIDYKKFLYTINQYKDNTSNIELIIDKDEFKVKFTIKNKTDKISLPVVIEKSTRIIDYDDMLMEPTEYNISLTSENNKDLLIELNKMFKDAFIFISKEEQKNNAGSLFSNKFIVNDKRHIYVQKSNKLNELNIEEYITIHKKNMRIFNETLNTENKYKFILSLDNSKIYIETIGFKGLFNNALANAIPPEEEDLENLTSTNIIFKSTVDDLYKAITFFNGFYSTSSEIKSISYKTLPDNELMLYLKDSGIAGFGEYSIEKTLHSSHEVQSEFESIESIVIFDSIKDFLNKEEPTKDIIIYSDKETMAILLKTDNSEIYIAKLQG